MAPSEYGAQGIIPNEAARSRVYELLRAEMARVGVSAPAFVERVESFPPRHDPYETCEQPCSIAEHWFPEREAVIVTARGASDSL